jgi:hypothetical protein
MLRIVTADVDRFVIVRDDELTLVVRPAIVNREDGRRQAQTLLTEEEQSIVRAAVGVATGLPDWRFVTPEMSCACYIPKPLRATGFIPPCPWHAEAEKLSTPVS